LFVRMAHALSKRLCKLMGVIRSWFRLLSIPMGS